MSDRILLDLSRGEFDDNFSENELWQKRAAGQLVKALSDTGKQAKSYKDKRSKGGKLQSIHDAIFVAGARGTGKSVFLRNAEAIWKDSGQDVDLYFCTEVDPTLLVNHDNFANVVIAHLYNTVEEKFEKNCCDKDYENRDGFYLALKKLANALGQAEHNDEHVTGIDRIIGYRTGIQLERCFHDFSEQCINILNVDAIVLPIDDVDMALGRAYEVLDVVRRLLGCPFIIPIVSGDENLYRPILEDHFSKLGRQNGIGVLKNSIPKELTQAYLTKVFPSQWRVVLEPIDQLLSKLNLKEPGVDLISYTDYVKELVEKFYTFTNGEEKSSDWPKPENARELTQLTKMLPPSSTAGLQSDISAFKSWAYVKQHGAAYADSISTEQLGTLDSSEFSLGKLISFNPIQQVKEPDAHWKNKVFYDANDKTLSSLELATNNQDYLLDDIKGKPLLRSMPTLEYYTPQLVIPNFKDQLKGKGSNVRILAALYTHRNYYGTAQQTSAQIFFSKAFDLLVSSLLIAKEPSADDRKEFWTKILERQLTKLPFYSVYSVAPTKVIDNKLPGSDSDMEEVIDSSDSDKIDFSRLSSRLVEWERHYGKSLVQMQSLNVLPLISAVFNKVFTQLHMLREDRKTILKNDYFTDLVKRFEYIVINAFATFIKPDSVVLTNIARTKTPKNIRNFDAFKASSNAFRNNVISFVGAREEFKVSERTVDVTNEPKELLKAIWAHPLFGLIGSQSSSPESPISDVYLFSEKKSDDDNKIKSKKSEGTKKHGKLPGLDTLEVYKNMNKSDFTIYFKTVANDLNLSAKTVLKDASVERRDKGLESSRLQNTNEVRLRWLKEIVNLDNS